MKLMLLSLHKKPYTRRLSRLVSLLVTLSFIFPYLSWAFESDAFQAANKAFLFNHQAITIPGKHGTITESFQGKDRLIVYIQDLHCNQEVQTNIANIIKHMARKSGLKLVGVEGASGRIDLGKLAGFPVKMVKREVGKYFLQQGKIGGPEYYAAVGEYPVCLQGIEQAEYYQSNQESLMKFLNNESQGYVYDLREMLEKLKEQVYGKKLKAHDQQRTGFREGRKSLLDYAVFLYRAGKRTGLEMESFPQLCRYVCQRRNVFPVAVDSDALYTEMDRMERVLREGLHQSGAEQEMDILQRRLDVIEKLVNISVSTEELAEYRENPEAFRVRIFLDFAEQYNIATDFMLDPGLYGLDEYLKEAEEFYKVADKRSGAFVEQTLAGMKQSRTDLAILVTGGYHSGEVMQEMRRQGISYLCVKPRLRRVDIINPYFSLLKNRATPLEKLLTQNQNILALPILFPKQAKLGAEAGRSLHLKQEKQEQTFLKLLDLMLKVALILHLMREGIKGISHLKQAYTEVVGAWTRNNPLIDIFWENVKTFANNTAFYPMTPGFTVVIRPRGTRSKQEKKPLLTVALNSKYEACIVREKTAKEMRSRAEESGERADDRLPLGMVQVQWYGPLSALVLGGAVAVSTGLARVGEGIKSRILLPGNTARQLSSFKILSIIFISLIADYGFTKTGNLEFIENVASSDKAKREIAEKKLLEIIPALSRAKKGEIAIRVAAYLDKDYGFAKDPMDILCTLKQILPLLSKKDKEQCVIPIANSMQRHISHEYSKAAINTISLIVPYMANKKAKEEYALQIAPYLKEWDYDLQDEVVKALELVVPTLSKKAKERVFSRIALIIEHYDPRVREKVLKLLPQIMPVLSQTGKIRMAEQVADCLCADYLQNEYDYMEIRSDIINLLGQIVPFLNRKKRREFASLIESYMKNSKLIDVKKASINALAEIVPLLAQEKEREKYAIQLIPYIAHWYLNEALADALARIVPTLSETYKEEIAATISKNRWFAQKDNIHVLARIVPAISNEELRGEYASRFLTNIDDWNLRDEAIYALAQITPTLSENFGKLKREIASKFFNDIKNEKSINALAKIIPALDSQELRKKYAINLIIQIIQSLPLFHFENASCYALKQVLPTLDNKNINILPKNDLHEVVQAFIEIYEKLFKMNIDPKPILENLIDGGTASDIKALSSIDIEELREVKYKKVIENIFEIYKGKIPEQVELLELLSKIAQAVEFIPESQEIILKQFKEWRKEPLVSTFGGRARELMDAGLRLLPELLSSQDSVGSLLNQMQLIQNGGFNGGKLHIDLNYHLIQEQLKLSLIKREITYKEFLEFVEKVKVSDIKTAQAETILPELQREVRGLVYEGYLVREQILSIKRRAKELSRPLLVIENLSYGAVASAPITQEINGLKYITGTDIPVISTKIGSTPCHGDEYYIREDLFNYQEVEYILSQQPIIVVIDASTSVSAPERTSPHIPDGFKGYRNYVAALNKALRDKLEVANLLEDKEFEEKLLKDSRFKSLTKYLKDIKNKLSHIDSIAQAYRLFFWYPGKKDLYLRVNKKKETIAPKIQDVNQIQGPSLIFIQAAIEPEAVPGNIRENFIKDRHHSAFFDDKDHFKRFYLDYEPGYGVVLSKLMVNLSRRYFQELRTFLGLGEIRFPKTIAEVLTLKRESDIIILDLDGTLAKIDKPLSEDMVNVLENLLGKGKHIVIITEDIEENLDARLISLIPNTLRNNLSIFSSGGAKGFGFDREGGKVYYEAYNRKGKIDAALRQKVLDLLNINFKDQYQLDRRANRISPDCRIDLHQIPVDRDELVLRMKSVLFQEGISAHVYKVGRNSIKIVIQHKADAMRYILKQKKIDESRALIIADQARTNRVDRELLSLFPRAVSINVGRYSNSIRKLNANIIQRAYAGIAGTKEILLELVRNDSMDLGQLRSINGGDIKEAHYRPDSWVKGSKIQFSLLRFLPGLGFSLLAISYLLQTPDSIVATLGIVGAFAGIGSVFLNFLPRMFYMIQLFRKPEKVLTNENIEDELGTRREDVIAYIQRRGGLPDGYNQLQFKVLPDQSFWANIFQGLQIGHGAKGIVSLHQNFLSLSQACQTAILIHEIHEATGRGFLLHWRATWREYVYYLRNIFKPEQITIEKDSNYTIPYVARTKAELWPAINAEHATQKLLPAGPNEPYRGRRTMVQRITNYLLRSILYISDVRQAGKPKNRFPSDGIVYFFSAALFLFMGTLLLWVMRQSRGAGRDVELSRILVEVQADEVAVEIFAKYGGGDLLRPRITVLPLSRLGFFKRLACPLGYAAKGERGQPVVYVPDALLRKGVNETEIFQLFLLQLILNYQLRKYCTRNRVDTVMGGISIKYGWWNIVIPWLWRLVDPQGLGMLKPGESHLARELLKQEMQKDVPEEITVRTAYLAWAGKPDIKHTRIMIDTMLSLITRQSNTGEQARSIATLSKLCIWMTDLEGVQVGEWDTLPEGVTRKEIVLPGFLSRKENRDAWRAIRKVLKRLPGVKLEKQKLFTPRRLIRTPDQAA